jgi:hypothetical protein
VTDANENDANANANENDQRLPAVLAVSSATPGAAIAQTAGWDGCYARRYADVPDARRLFVKASQV